MANLHNLVEQYLDGLNHLDKLAGDAISDYTASNKTFGNTADKLRQNSQRWDISVPFQGLGADAFYQAVKANQTRAGILIAKLNDFQVACENTSKAIESATKEGDDLSNYYLHGWQDEAAADFLHDDGRHGFVEKLILDTLIDSVVTNTTLDRMLNPSNAASDIETGLESGAYALKQEARSTMFEKEQRFCDSDAGKQILETYGTKGLENQPAYKQITEDYNETCSLIDELKSRVFDGISAWALNMQTYTESGLEDFDAAAALNMPTLGDMITLLNTTYKNQSVVIWQTPNGGLLVMVNGSHVSASQVEADIEQYMLAHKLKNAPITLVGYKGGTNVAQQVVEDLYDHPSDYHFTIPNVVMVGGGVPDRSKNMYAGTNYLVYQMLPEQEGQSSPLTAEQWTIMGLTAIAGIALTPLTAGGSDEAAAAIDGAELAEAGGDALEASKWLEAIKEEAADLAKEKAIEFNADVLYNSTHPESEPEMSKILAEMANNQYSDNLSGGLMSHPYAPAGQTPTVDPNTGLPQSPAGPYQSIKGKLYYDNLILIPDEEGMNKGTYMNSSFLDRQPLPDPVLSSSPKVRLGSPPIILPDQTNPNAIPLTNPEAYP